MPACRWRPNTTRVASSNACSLGSAASQSGTGYEPTVVVRIRGALRGIIMERHRVTVLDFIKPLRFTKEIKHPRTQIPKCQENRRPMIWVFRYLGTWVFEPHFATSCAAGHSP